MKIIGTLSLLIGVVGVGHASTYFVSSLDGNDANSGRSPTQAWKTISRVNRARLVPGDKVLFERGDLWRETLQPFFSGASGSPITYGAYGSGPKPVISGSDPVSFMRISRAANGLEYFENVETQPATMWNHGKRMTRVAELVKLQKSSQWWYDAAKKRVYFMQPPPRELEVQARDLNIDNHEQSHIVYEDLDLQHACEGLRLYAWRSTVSDIVLRNSRVSTEPSIPHHTMSAGVYESVNTGKLLDIRIEDNIFTPYPNTLEHWGVYFVKGVSGFNISGNSFSPAGEDAITIWHSERGVISNNSGGGNGENTIDVKDSHDIVIKANRADGDGEYCIVVHGVDSDRLTYNVTVEKNLCIRGGQAGQLTAGIVLLFTRSCNVRNNEVQEAYGAGIFINDRGTGFGNEISGNVLKKNGTRRTTGAITLEDPTETEVYGNSVYEQGSNGYALRLENGPHLRTVRIRDNKFFSAEGRMLDIATPAEAEWVSDNNTYCVRRGPLFRWKLHEYSFDGWQAATHQDMHSGLGDATQRGSPGFSERAGAH